MKKSYIVLLTLFSITLSFSQIKNPFDVRYQSVVRGDLTMISNSIVGKVPTNTAYNLTGSASVTNDVTDMQFIDVDTDSSTFNSSSAKLNVPDVSCARIVYAGLYWAATYRYETGNDPSSGRYNDWNTVKFKTPNGSYQTITANEVLYSGFDDPIQTNVNHGPYSCYADVTQFVSNLANPNGDYFAANIRVSKDGRLSSQFPIQGGVAGGWTMVVVYENLNLPGKKITTFDGHAVIASGSGSLDIPVSGFSTLPSPLPVNARFGVTALEGDNTISGDQLSIKANSNAAYTLLYNTPTPAAPITNNFFNSSITVDGLAYTNRFPNSINTLGWDSHLTRINNPGNSVIPNNETGVTLRATTTQDKYDIFLTTFDVEIIQPYILVLNEVEDFSGSNINGQSVNRGDEFYYKISFQNVGNDDALNLSISDQLPVNIIFPSSGTIQPGDIILPSGVTFTYNGILRNFEFSIPNSLVEKNDPIYSIKIKVKVEDNCQNLEQACSNIISSQVFSSYQGFLNPTIITDNPSSAGFNVCAVGVQSATTNVIADISQCVFDENVTLCQGQSITLSAPNGFSEYSWINSTGGIIAATQTITVSSLGIYTVLMNTPLPCASYSKTFTVVDCNLSNQNFTFNNFKLYPNPVKNTVSISNNSVIDALEIYSIIGQKMLSKQINSLATELDLSQLSIGIYFVKISSEGSEKTVKIVKE